MNGVIYCRVSSKEQTEGTSLESQELACRDYARSKDIKVLKTFIERGESAKFADRTQLLELIDFCRQNKGNIQSLLVWKIDRFARNVGDHFSVKATLMKYGVRIVSVTEPIDANPEGRLMETILAGFAQFDNDIRAMRTVQGMRRKIQEGIFPWKPPLGYKSSGKNSEKKTEPDQPNQPLFGLLQKAWRAFATGAYSKAEIRRLMRTWGIQTESGKPMSPQSVDHLFRSRFYAGLLVDPWSGEEHEGKHPAMVTRQEFAYVQEIVARRNRSIPHQKERPEFPLRGVVRCSHCRNYLTASFSRGRSKRYPYYHCANRTCPCRGKSLSRTDLHQEFENFLGTVVPKPELIERLGGILIQKANERREFIETKKSRAEAGSAKLNRQLQELIRMRTQGLITDEEFLAQKTLLSERQCALEIAAHSVWLPGGRVEEHLEEITEPLLNLKSFWQMLAHPLQRRFQRFLLPVGFIKGSIRTAELGLFFRVLDQFSESESNGVPLSINIWNRFYDEFQEFWKLIKDYHEAKKGSKEAVPEYSNE